MCCRWGECVVGGRATFGPPLQMGDATRCWGVRRGTPRRYKKTGRINAQQAPWIQAAGLFPILDLFGGLPSRCGRLYGDCKFPFSISKISTFSAQ